MIRYAKLPLKSRPIICLLANYKSCLERYSELLNINLPKPSIIFILFYLHENHQPLAQPFFSLSQIVTTLILYALISEIRTHELLKP
jgi:hypothetical protein